MLLTVWTSADAQLIRRTIGETLTAMRPAIPEHCFVDCDDETLVEAGPGEVVVVCGTRPLQVLMRHGLAPKNRTINSLREKRLPLNGPGKEGTGGSYLVTFDPRVTESEPDKRQIIDWDVRLATRLLRTGSLEPVLGSYRWVGDFEELIAAINVTFEATGRPVDVSCDTETMGLYPWYPDKDLVSIGFTCEAGRADVLYTGPRADPVPVSPQIRDQVAWLLNSPRIKLRGANLK